MQIDGGGSRERRHGAALEPLEQSSDALGGVGATKVGDATELVAREAASEEEKNVKRGLNTSGQR